MEPNLRQEIDFQAERKKCQEDFFHFINFILIPLCPGGEFDLSNAEHFQQMYRLIKGDPNFTLSAFGEYSLATNNQYHNRKIGILPRYHGKTTIGTIALSMWWLLRNPNERILIMSEIWDNARAMLRMIKELYEKIAMTKNTDNAYIYYTMGDWRGSLWNEDEIIVSQRTQSGTNPSIATAGMEREVTSKHFSKIICDDLLGESNTRTPGQLKRAIQHFSSLTEVGDVHGKEVTDYIIWGTPWDYADLYSLILEKLKEQYDILKLRCWDDRTCDNPQRVLFPEKFTLEYLNNIYKQKMEIGDLPSFYMQYLCEPIPEHAAVFRKEDIQFFDMEDVKNKHLTVVIAIDPALSENEWSDDSAIVAVGIDKAGRRYVLEYDVFQESKTDKVCAHIIGMAKKYWNNNLHELQSVGIEEGWLKNTIEPHLMKYAPWMPLVKLKHGNEKKIFRIIQSLQPFVATKRIYVQRWMDKLLNQMYRFPKSNIKRDLLDALAYHVQLVPVWEMEPQPPSHKNREKKFWETLKAYDKVGSRRSPSWINH